MRLRPNVMRYLVLFAALLAAPVPAQEAARVAVWGGGITDLHALGGEAVLAARADWLGRETSALFRSDDDGRTWRRAEPFAASSFGPLAVGEDGAVYLGTRLGTGAELLRSADGGASWATVDVPGGLDLRGLAAGAAGRIVAIGGRAASGVASEMWVTDDGGATWEERALPVGYGRPVALGRDLFVVESGYGGGELFRWAEAGAGWERVDVVDRPDAVYRTREGALFVALQRGNYPSAFSYVMARSDDGGATWAETGWGRLEADPLSVACDGATCYTTFFGDPYAPAGGVVAFDGAERRTLGALPHGADPGGLVAAGGRLLVADLGGRGVYASDDSGQTWALSNQGIDAPSLAALAHDGTWALADGFRGPNRLLRAAPDGRWLDAGPTWGDGEGPSFFLDIETFAGEAFLAELDLVLATADGADFRPWPFTRRDDGVPPWRLTRLPGRLLAAEPHGLLATTDGVDWQRIPFDLPLAGRLFDDVADAVEVDGALVVSVRAGGTSAEHGRGIWRSDDDGQTWARALDAPVSVDALAALAGGAVVAAGTDVVFRSADGGRSFAAVDASPAGVIAFAESGPAAYAATPSALFRTLDGGATWAPFADLGETLRALASDAPGRLLVGTADGLFRVVDTSVSVAARPARPHALAVRVGPNPTAGAATVSVDIPQAGVAGGAVFDALGRRVAVLPARAARVGEAVWRLDAAGLAPGVYLVRVWAGAHVGAVRLTVR